MGFDRTEILVRTGDGRNATLVEAFSFTTKAGTVITVPAGSQSDGASTPRAIWQLLPPFGRYWLAAFLHDFLYRYTYLPKAYCDSILVEAMEWLDVDPVESKAIYDGVAIGGQAAFDADRAALDAEMAAARQA